MKSTLQFLVVSVIVLFSQAVLSLAESPEAVETPFVAGASYNDTIPNPKNVLGYALGSKAVTASEVEKCIKTWASVSNRVHVVEYARSHENRPLHYVIVSDPTNLIRLETIKTNLSQLGDPRDLSDQEVTRLIEETPPIAWLAYTIHGDETEGSDAALAVLYHLIADTDPVTSHWLNDMVIIIDPLMNPDGPIGS